jgi:hypothetical protein
MREIPGNSSHVTLNVFSRLAESRSIVQQASHKMDELLLELKASLIEAEDRHKANASKMTDMFTERA